MSIPLSLFIIFAASCSPTLQLIISWLAVTALQHIFYHLFQTLMSWLQLWMWNRIHYHVQTVARKPYYCIATVQNNNMWNNGSCATTKKIRSHLFCDKPSRLIHTIWCTSHSLWRCGRSANILCQTFQTCAETAVFTEMLINVQCSSIKINLIIMWK